MKCFYVIKIILLTFLLCSCTWLFADFKAPKVSLVSIEPVQFGLFEQRFNLRLRLQNTHDAGLRFKGIAYALQIDGVDFAEGVSDADISIPEYGEIIIDVPVMTNIGMLLKQLGRIDSDTIRYKLKGHVGVLNKHVKVPFNHEGEFKIGF